MYRKYYSYNDMPVPVRDGGGQKAELAREECAEEKKKAVRAEPVKKSGGILSGIENDDIILLVVILALLMDGCEDRLLLAAIAFVLLAGWI